MTVIAGMTATGPAFVLACESSVGVHPLGNPTTPPPDAEPLRKKLHALSSRHAIAVGLAGAVGITRGRFSQTMPDLVARVRRRLDGEDAEHLEWTLDPSAYRVEEVARRLAAEILAVFGPLWRPGEWAHGCKAWVAGFDAGSMVPRLFYFTLEPGKGMTEFGEMCVGGGAFVSPHAAAGEVAMRQLVTRQPRDIDHAAELLRQIIQRQIDHTAKYPSPDLTAEGPICTLALTPGAPPFFLSGEDAPDLTPTPKVVAPSGSRVQVAPGLWLEITPSTT